LNAFNRTLAVQVSYDRNTHPNQNLASEKPSPQIVSVVL
jgi:hypothetical protein